MFAAWNFLPVGVDTPAVSSGPAALQRREAATAVTRRREATHQPTMVSRRITLRMHHVEQQQEDDKQQQGSGHARQPIARRMYSSWQRDETSRACAVPCTPAKSAQWKASLLSINRAAARYGEQQAARQQ